MDEKKYPLSSVQAPQKEKDLIGNTVNKPGWIFLPNPSFIQKHYFFESNCSKRTFPPRISDLNDGAEYFGTVFTAAAFSINLIFSSFSVPPQDLAIRSGKAIRPDTGCHLKFWDLHGVPH